MKASVGDRLVVNGLKVGDHDRDGTIVDVQGAAGSPPYLVEWSSDGHQGLIWPGPDATVQHLKHSAEDCPGRGAGA